MNFQYVVSLVVCLWIANSAKGQDCKCVSILKCKALQPKDGVFTAELRARIVRLRCGPQTGVINVRCCNDGKARTSLPKRCGQPGPAEPVSQVVAVPSNSASPPHDVSKKDTSSPPQLSFPHVFGGSKIQLWDHPWLAGFVYTITQGSFSEQRQICGGSLITDRHVLTAAHCVTDLSSSQVLDHIKLGEWDKRTDPDCTNSTGTEKCAPPVAIRKAAKITIHPQYDKGTRRNPVYDAAVVRLDQPVQFGLSIQPICLPDADESDPTLATVVGFGHTEKWTLANIARQVLLPYVYYDGCNEEHNGALRNPQVQMCYGGVAGEDACGGDSGGPLLANSPLPTNSGLLQIVSKVYGIVSFGLRNCGRANSFGVYTRVSHLRSWIEEAIQQ